MDNKYSDEQKIFLNKLGKKIRNIRERKSIAQEKLAILAGIDRSFLGRIERGEKNISVLKLKKIAKALDIPLVSFLKDIS